MIRVDRIWRVIAVLLGMVILAGLFLFFGPGMTLMIV